MPQIITLAGQAGHLLLAWMAIIVMAQGLGRVFRHLHQPAVMGEVIGGILLGPSLFGVFFPEAKAFLFPPDIRPWIGWIAQLGIVFYMFFVGLELDWPGLRRSGRSTVAISVASILIPFLLGLAFASAVETDLSGPATQRMHYLLFVGVAMSVTAFPVLARILSETGLRGTPLGNLSLACAALNDVAAWCLLAVVISLAHANPAQGGWTLLLVGAYVAAMIWIVRPLLKKMQTRGWILLLVLLAGSAYVADWIGIHAIFGAFLLGAIVPKAGMVGDPLAHRAEKWVKILLLPTFFAFTGLRTQINLLNSPHDWGLCALVIVLATAGKCGGTAVAARWFGYRWPEALTLGVLMNTRGLVELIVLNAGLELNLISAKMFTILVVMALVTTLMTCPLLQCLRRRELRVHAV